MNKIQAKEPQIPAYLNEVCLEKVLQKNCRTNCSIKLLNWDWKLANVTGGNYCSNIFRVSGNYEILPSKESEKFSFIIKDMKMEIAENGTSEMIMLESILPEMMHILENNTSEENTKTSNKLAPNCFWIQTNKEHEFYILDDLNALGYEIGSRYEGLSLEEAQLVMQKIAKFHAVSMVYAEKFPNMIAKLKRNEFANSTPDPLGRTFTNKCMESIKEILPAFYEEIFNEIKMFLKKYIDKAEDAVNPQKSTFNVINHGDLWVNNILFKVKNQKEKDAIFVDFQNSFWGSPTCDLNNFLYMSLPLITLQTQRFELLQLYYKTLKSMLESFKFTKIPTWSDLLIEIKRGAALGFYVALCEYPFCVMSDEAAEDFQNKDFVESTRVYESIYKTPKVCEFIKHAVLYFKEIGLFDE